MPATSVRPKGPRFCGTQPPVSHDRRRDAEFITAGSGWAELFVMDGTVSADGDVGGNARITGPSELTISTGEGAEIMLMDLV